MTLEEASEFITDGTHGSPRRTEDACGIPLLSAKNVFDGEVRWDDFDRVPPSELEEFRKRVSLKKGDVLMTCVGTIGRAAVWLYERPVLFFRSVAIIRPKRILLPGYLEYAIRSEGFQRELRRRIKQSSQAGVYLKDIKAMSINVPPLPEQERIVKLLDEADELRKIRTQANRHTADLIPALFHEMFGDPGTNPREWPIKRLGKLAEIVMGQAPPGKACNHENNGTPFVKAGEFGKTRPIIREWTTKPLRMAMALDVLVCVVGATAGKLNLGANCAIGRSVGAIRFIPSLIEQNYLYVFLHYWTQLLRAGSQGSAQGVITKGMLERIPIPLPPLPLQSEFAKQVNDIRELEAVQASCRCQLEELFQSLLYRAFTGEL